MQLEKIKQQFPIFTTHPELVYLDTAASAQKPQILLDSFTTTYSENYANIHRGNYSLSEKSTFCFEQAREKISQFIGAKPHEIVFVRNSTEAMNLIASAWACPRWVSWQKILTTPNEHNSNYLPWTQNIVSSDLFEFITFKQDYQINFSDFEKHLDQSKHGQKIGLISLAPISNVLGYCLDMQTVMLLAKKYCVPLMVDASQWILHEKLDLSKMSIDFLVFSAHKLYGPSGLGILYVNEKWHKNFGRYQTGGGTVIDAQNLYQPVWEDFPNRLEAGTPFIEGVIAFAQVLDWYQQNIDQTQLNQYYSTLGKMAIDRLKEIPNCQIISAPDSNSMISFVLGSHHSSDVGVMLDAYKIAVRAGKHCAHLLHKNKMINNSIRASWGIYTQPSDIEKLGMGLEKCQKILNKA